MNKFRHRLKEHSGKDMAWVMMVLGFMAGSGNKSFDVWWHGGLFGTIMMGIFCWGVILWSCAKDDNASKVSE